MSDKVELAKMYRNYTAGKLASYFKVAKDTLITQLGDEIMIDSPDCLMEGHFFDSAIYTCHLPKMQITKFLKLKTFKNSSSFEMFVQGQGMTANSDYALAIHINGSIFIIQKFDKYEDINAEGAIIVRDEEEECVYAIMLIDVWLQWKYPREVVEPD